MAPHAAPHLPASGGDLPCPHAYAAVTPLPLAVIWPPAPSTRLPDNVPPPPPLDEPKAQSPPPPPITLPPGIGFAPLHARPAASQPPKAFSGSAEWCQPAAGSAPSHALPAAPAAAPAAAIPPEVASLAPPPGDDWNIDDGLDSGPEADLDSGAPVRRTRPRSRSRPRPRSGADAASGARDEEEEDEVDLRGPLSDKQVAGLPDAKKAELRQVVKKFAKQKHICDQRESWQQNPFAASGAIMPQCDEKHAWDMEILLDSYCDPIPDAQAFLTGIPHKNDKPSKAGQLWDVVRALASKKVHYWAQLKDAVWGLGAASGAPAPFCEAYPDAVLGDGWTALTREALEATKYHAGIADDNDYVKHILHKHDGEVRHWGARWWTEVPDADVESLFNVKFWHYQFAKTPDARRFLFWHQVHQTVGNLPLADIDWVLEQEGGETTLLKREGGGSASGERGKWYIRGGNHINLAELFNYGCKLCSCHFLYTLYLRQPIFVARQWHSESKTPGAMLRRNAKSLRHHEAGKWALPWNPW